MGTPNGMGEGLHGWGGGGLKLIILNLTNDSGLERMSGWQTNRDYNLPKYKLVTKTKYIQQNWAKNRTKKQIKIYTHDSRFVRSRITPKNIYCINLLKDY